MKPYVLYYHEDDVSLICKFINGKLSIIRAIDHVNVQYYRVELNDCSGFVENEYPNTIEDTIIKIIQCDQTHESINEIVRENLCNDQKPNAFTYLSHDEDCTQFLLAYANTRTSLKWRTITFIDKGLNIVSVFSVSDSIAMFDVNVAKRNMYFTAVAMPLLLLDDDEFTNESVLVDTINAIPSFLRGRE